MTGTTGKISSKLENETHTVEAPEYEEIGTIVEGVHLRDFGSVNIRSEKRRINVLGMFCRIFGVVKLF